MIAGQSRPLELTTPSDSRLAWWLLAITLFAFLGPPLLRGDVIYPHDNSAEAGGAVEPLEGLDWWYQNVVSLYVPETAAHLADDHTGWLASWNPHNGLGRPLFQTGVGGAFFIARLVAFATRDPFLHFTLMTVLAVVLTGIFTQAFLLELRLHPLAAWTGAVGLSVGPLYPGWGLLPLNQWGFCWAFGCLLFLQRWLRTGGRWNLVALGVCIHSVLLTGYQQHVLGLGWIVGGWVCLSLHRSGLDRACKWRALAIVVGVTVASVVSVLPSYLDLYEALRASVRADHVIERHTDLGRNLLSILFFADAGAGPGPRPYSLGPVYCTLAILGTTRFRGGAIGYWTCWAVLILLASSTTEFASLFRALGMSFSNWLPLNLLHLPAAILAGVAVDSLLGGGRLTGRMPYGLRAIALAALVLFAALAGGQELIVWQPRAAIVTDSEVARALHEATADGTRFALVGRRRPDSRWLPPNQEIVLGLRGIQSYYHMPSRAFHRWAQPLRPADHTGDYDRRLLGIPDPEALDEEHLAFSAISTLVSFDPLPDSRQVGPVHIQRLASPGPLRALVPSSSFQRLAGEGARITPAVVRRHALAGGPLGPLTDRIEVRFEALEEESLLFLSQEFNARWQARAGGRRLETLPVNELFQGVLVPPHVRSLELIFRPHARWMLLSQGLLAMIAGLGLGRALLGLLAQSRGSASARGSRGERGTQGAPRRPGPG